MGSLFSSSNPSAGSGTPTSQVPQVGDEENGLKYNGIDECDTPLEADTPSINLQLRRNSRYDPSKWKCKYYDPEDTYIYFDGAEGSSDIRFLIDLETPSMER
jgi:hypothetical protein